jgi:hypothetical protein
MTGAGGFRLRDSGQRRGYGSSHMVIISDRPLQSLSRAHLILL